MKTYNKLKRVLYLTYDGILEPLGYSQILSYLQILSREHKIIIISIEKKGDLLKQDHFKKIKNIIKKSNIEWFYLKYTNNTFLRFALILKLIFLTTYILLFKKIDIVHSRSYISGLVTYFLKFFFNVFFVFDIRGFWIDERIEWGLWKQNSIKSIIFRFFEKKIYNKSNVVVTLTTDAKEIILKGNKVYKKNIFTIPTSVNLNKKNNLYRSEKILTFTHLGAIGSRYDFNLYLKIMNELGKNNNILLSIINKNEHPYIKEQINKYNFNPKYICLKYIHPYNINDELKNTNFGIFFPVKGFYLNAYFPTKLGEFLTNGVPIITCKINKHVDTLITENNVGIILDNKDNINYEQLNNKIINILNDINISLRCKKVAEDHFDINKATNIYSKIYKLAKS